jgi:hypothetical protein
MQLCITYAEQLHFFPISGKPIKKINAADGNEKVRKYLIY